MNTIDAPSGSIDQLRARFGGAALRLLPDPNVSVEEVLAELYVVAPSRIVTIEDAINFYLDDVLHSPGAWLPSGMRYAVLTARRALANEVRTVLEREWRLGTKLNDERYGRYLDTLGEVERQEAFRRLAETHYPGYRATRRRRT